MSKYYPAFLDLSGKNVLLIGGGAVALQKARGLVRAGGKILVIAPEIAPGFEALERSGKALLSRKSFTPKDLSGKDLVFCATDDEALNARVSRLCNKRRIWANVVDRTKLCAFIVPAVARRGNVVVAISTGGTSPALAKFLRKKIERMLGNEVAVFSKLLKKHRPEFLKLPMASRIKALERAVTEESLAALRRGETRKVERMLAGIAG